MKAIRSGAFHGMLLSDIRGKDLLDALRGLIEATNVLTITKIALPIVVQSSGTVYPQLLGKQHL